MIHYLTTRRATRVTKSQTPSDPPYTRKGPPSTSTRRARKATTEHSPVTCRGRKAATSATCPGGLLSTPHARKRARQTIHGPPPYGAVPCSFALRIPAYSCSRAPVQASACILLELGRVYTRDPPFPFLLIFQRKWRTWENWSFGAAYPPREGRRSEGGAWLLREASGFLPVSRTKISTAPKHPFLL